MAEELTTTRPEVQAPLAAFNGEPPPAPAWFEQATAKKPERSFVTVDGAKIELLTWGERGKPGLLLVHGNSAHADWWSFIAPYLAEDHRVAALSLSGMGGSDWRENYSFDIFADELHACAEAAGLYDGPEKPVYIGHSFGGSQVFFAAMKHPDWMRAAILVDTGFGPPPDSEGARQPPPMRSQPNRVYLTLAAALARFRFMPLQGCSNFFIADFIARRSLKRVPLPESEGAGGGEGWTWRFDPFMWGKLNRTPMSEMGKFRSDTPLVHIYGENSVVRARSAGSEGILPADIKQISIPDSEHHVLVDQPLALIAALRSVLAFWPKG
jgi:pimeloyl-ACP methyl ester carboxylesterase